MFRNVCCLSRFHTLQAQRLKKELAVAKAAAATADAGEDAALEGATPRPPAVSRIDGGDLRRETLAFVGELKTDMMLLTKLGFVWEGHGALSFFSCQFLFSLSRRACFIVLSTFVSLRYSCLNEKKYQFGALKRFKHLTICVSFT
jgi:hypothetical protein